MRRWRRALAGSAVILTLVLGLGCDDEGPQLHGADAGTVDAGGGPSRQSFESALGGEASGSAGSGGGGGRGPIAPPLPDPTSMIEEADVVQLDGDRLYALSTYGPLNVIDVSVPDELRWLGSYSDPDDTDPFAMYLRDGIALVVYRSWGPQQRTSGIVIGDQAGRVVALDVRDPAHVRELGDHVVSGTIVNTHLADDVLYVVSHRDGECVRCTPQPARTSIVSLDVSDPSQVRPTGELHLDDAIPFGQHEVPVFHVARERIYVARSATDAAGVVDSSIQVVDISDPAGALAEGATVQVQGTIVAPWQMNEWDGVLRVVSQPRPNEATWVVETFAIASSQELAPLATLDLDPSGAGGLRTMHFDGERAFAIGDQNDPVHIVDLSDPAAPEQRGEVDTTGALLHLEPRGERVLGFAVDWESPAGAIVVSLFDVSDMQEPALLGSARFGGQHGQLTEEHASLHNVSRVLEALGLILVPHVGVGTRCGESVEHAVQLVEWDTVEDALALGASVPVRGLARRALVYDDTLLTVTEDHLARLDLRDRSAPVPESDLALSREVTRTIPMASGSVARIDEWTEDTSDIGLTIDFVEPAGVERAAPGSGELTQDELFGGGSEHCGFVRLHDVFAIDDRLVLLYENDSGYGVLVIDARDTEAPSVLSKIEWARDPGSSLFESFTASGVHAAVAHTAQAVAILETQDTWPEPTRQRLRVVDLRAPHAPTMTVVDLPSRPGQTGLLVDDDTLVTSYWEPTEQERSVRYFLDRWDLSDPTSPRQLPPINVPGAVLYYDGAAERAVTVDLTEVDSFESTSAQQCAERFAVRDHVSGGPSDGLCRGYQQHLRLLRLGEDRAELLDTYDVDILRVLRAHAAGDDVLYVDAAESPPPTAWMPYQYVCHGPCPEQTEPSVLLALSGLSGDRIQVASLEVQADTWWRWWSSSPVYAAGSHVIVVGGGQIQIVDATDPTKLEPTRTERVGRSVRHVAATADAALLSRGLYGARYVELRP